MTTCASASQKNSFSNNLTASQSDSSSASASASAPAPAPASASIAFSSPSPSLPLHKATCIKAQISDRERASSRAYTHAWLFEFAWEVANRIGGIYTVIRTKVPVTALEYGRHYVLVGPLNYNAAALEVESLDPVVALPEIAATLDSMRCRGIHFVFGRWLIDGAPFVLLFDIGSAFYLLDSWKSELFDKNGISTPASDRETNDAIVFGFLAAWFLGEFTHRLNSKYASHLDSNSFQPPVLSEDSVDSPQKHPQIPIIAHFHEWMAALALPLIKERCIPVATVFTTHATLLGRYICAGSGDFYNNMHQFNVDREAGIRGIYHRYCIERAAAHACDVFTTVSHITAFESEHLLKRRPDGVLPNGLSLTHFAAVHEFQNLHAVYKEKIHNFVRGHFYGHMDFDLDNTLYFFTSGRYEFRNKGTDMFLEALARLNHRLRSVDSPVTVVAFIIMPAPNSSFNVEALKGQAIIKSLKETVNDIQRQIGNRIFESALRGEVPTFNIPSASSSSISLAASSKRNSISSTLPSPVTPTGAKEISPVTLLLPSEQISLKRRILSLRRETLPPVVTHNLIDDANDAVLSAIRRLNLINNSQDKVKLVFHPEFLNASSPLLGLDYDEFVRGCHLGVFPSYYEPWGYTPAECTVMGVPSITTNLSGFGGYMMEILERPDDYGIFIVDRQHRSVEDSVNMLTDKMHSFCIKSRRQRINLRNRTERLSDLLDWKRLGLEYVKARHLALRRKFPGIFENSRRTRQTTAKCAGGEKRHDLGTTHSYLDSHLAPCLSKGFNTNATSPSTMSSYRRVLQEELSVDICSEFDIPVPEETNMSVGKGDSVSFTPSRSPSCRRSKSKSRFRNMHLLTDEELSVQVIEQLSLMGIGQDDDDVDYEGNENFTNNRTSSQETISSHNDFSDANEGSEP